MQYRPKMTAGLDIRHIQNTGNKSPTLKYTETDLQFELLAEPDKMKDNNRPVKVTDSKEQQKDIPNPLDNNKDILNLDTPKDDKRREDTPRNNQPEYKDTKQSYEKDNKDEFHFSNKSDSSHKHHSDKKKTPRISLSEEDRKPRRQETANERKTRADEMYRKIIDLEDNHKMKPSRKCYPDDDADVLEREYNSLKEQKDKRNGIIFYRKSLLAGVSVVEFLNDRYDPLAINLNGWYESMNCSIEEYTEIFEDLHEKYKGAGGKLEPEVRLLFSVVFSAFSFHISKEFSKHIVPKQPQAIYFPPQQSAQQQGAQQQGAQQQMPLPPYVQQQPINFANMFGAMNGGKKNDKAISGVQPIKLNTQEQLDIINNINKQGDTRKNDNVSLNISDLNPEHLDINSPTSTQKKNSSVRKKRAFVIDTSGRK